MTSVSQNVEDSFNFTKKNFERRQSRRDFIDQHTFKSLQTFYRQRESEIFKKDDQIINNDLKPMLEVIQQSSKPADKTNIKELSTKDCQLPKIQQTKQNNFLSTIFKLKLHYLAKRIVNQIRSRMFMNITQKQLKLIDDKSSFVYPQKLKQTTQKSNVLLNRIISSHKDKKKQMQRHLTMLRKSDPIDSKKDHEEESQSSLDYMKLLFKRYFKMSDPLKQFLNKVDNIFPVFNPNSFFKIIWDFVSMIMVLFFIIQIPLYICFESQFNQVFNKLLVILAPIFVIIDSFIIMNSGYYEKGMLINKRYSILTNYWKKYSATELFIIISYLLHYINLQPHGEVWTKYLLCVFVLKIKHLGMLFRKWEEYFVSKKSIQILDLIRLVLIIVTLSHFISTYWIKLAQIEKQLGYFNWLSVRNINDDDWLAIYIDAYYFSIVTMATVGYGDVLPMNPVEKLSCVVLMILSCGIFAYAMNTVGNILNSFNNLENEINRKMQIINTYMSKKNVNKQMQYTIREYLDYYWREACERDQYEEEKIISQLSDTIKENLLFEANKIVLKQSPIFKNNFSSRLKQSIIPIIKEYHCTPEEIICSQGKKDDCSIFFIEKGSVELFIENSQQSKQKSVQQSLLTLKKGQSFGEISFFTGQPRASSIRSKEFTTLLVIKRDQFIDLLEGCEEDFEQFCGIKDSLLLYNDYTCLDLKCYSCDSSYHLLNQCPFLHVNADQDKIVYNNNKNIEQIRNSFSRSVGRTINTLKQGTMSIIDCAIQCIDDNIYHPNVYQYFRGESEASSDEKNSEDCLQNQFGNTKELNNSQNTQKIMQSQLLQSQQINQSQQMYSKQNSQQSQYISSSQKNIQSMKSMFKLKKTNSICESEFESNHNRQNKLTIITNSSNRSGAMLEENSPKELQQKSLNYKQSTQLIPEIIEEDHDQEKYNEKQKQFMLNGTSPQNRLKHYRMNKLRNSFGDDKNFSLDNNESNNNWNSQYDEKNSPSLTKKSDYGQLRLFFDDKTSRQESISSVLAHKTEKQGQGGQKQTRLSKFNTENQKPKQKGKKLMNVLKYQYEQKLNFESDDNSRRKPAVTIQHQATMSTQNNVIHGNKIESSQNKQFTKQHLSINQQLQGIEKLTQHYNQYGHTLEDLDILKNYEYYFPFNNLNYQIQIIAQNQFNKKKRQQFQKNQGETQSIKVSSMHQKQTVTQYKRFSSMHKKNISNIAKKYKKYMEEYENQNNEHKLSKMGILSKADHMLDLQNYSKGLINNNKANSANNTPQQKGLEFSYDLEKKKNIDSLELSQTKNIKESLEHSSNSNSSSQESQTISVRMDNKIKSPSNLLYEDSFDHDQNIIKIDLNVSQNNLLGYQFCSNTIESKTNAQQQKIQGRYKNVYSKNSSFSSRVMYSQNKISMQTENEQSEDRYNISEGSPTKVIKQIHQLSISQQKKIEKQEKTFDPKND